LSAGSSPGPPRARFSRYNCPLWRQDIVGNSPRDKAPRTASCLIAPYTTPPGTASKSQSVSWTKSWTETPTTGEAAGDMAAAAAGTVNTADGKTFDAKESPNEAPQ